MSNLLSDAYTDEYLEEIGRATCVTLAGRSTRVTSSRATSPAAPPVARASDLGDMNIFTNTLTDRRMGELACNARRLKYFSTFTLEVPNRLVWLTVTFEHTTGRWVATLTNCLDNAHARAAEGGSEEWNKVVQMAESFIGEETNNADGQ